MIAASWWTANHVLLVLNAILTAAAVGTAVVAAMTIKASNKVTTAAERQAEATEATVATALEQLELGRNQLTQSIRPWLTIGSGETEGHPGVGPVSIDDRLASDDGPEGVYAFVRVRNVGSGLAILQPADSKIWGWDGHEMEPREFTSGGVQNPVLPQQEEQTVWFVVTSTGAWSNINAAVLTNQRIGSMQGTDGQFFVDIVYSDSMNDLVTRAKFHFAFVKDRGWVTNSVSYFTPPDSPDPLVARMRG